MNQKIAPEEISQELEAARYDVSRRHFLQLAGGLAGLGIFLSACSKGSNNNNLAMSGATVNLGSGDTGILNYAYALEQLEAAFYVQVINTPYSGMSAMERSLLTDIMYHEVAHRDFFKAALGSNAIPGLTVNFSSINFNDRTSVLTTARSFEDLGVSAYNGAGQLFSTTTAGATYLGLAGKIVSVEARHAATLHDLLNPNTFADNTVVDGNGLDVMRTPTQVLSMAGKYINGTINASGI